MKDQSDVWNQVLEKADARGLGVLSPSEAVIYHVNKFLIDYDMEGFSGVLYNLSPDFQRLVTIAAYFKEMGDDLTASILVEVSNIMASARSAAPTWAEYLKEVDPQDRLGQIQVKLNAATKQAWGHLEDFTERIANQAL